MTDTGKGTKTDFDDAGHERHPRVLAPGELDLVQTLADDLCGNVPAIRITNSDTLSDLLQPNGSMDRLAKSKLGNRARPVRAILFDKREDANWALGWHQDRTIAVCERIDVPGFDRWSVKSGLLHVEPPFCFIEHMVTLRAHLDACDADNAPLMIIPGSHRLGRLPKSEIKLLAGNSDSMMCEAGAGDIWVYASATVHASGAAKVPGRRRVLHVDYSAEDLPDGLEWLGI